MYKLIANVPGLSPRVVHHYVAGMFIPFDPGNIDYQQFKIDIKEGTPLQDSDGAQMTAEQIAELIQKLP